MLYHAQKLSTKVTMGNDEELVESAMRAAENSYSPYSKFRVGAALRAADGTVYLGTNVENRSYGLAICAERSAIVRAVTDGQRRFTDIAIYSPDSVEPLSPCGACRQVLSEFMRPEARLIFVGSNGARSVHSMAEVMPFDALHDLKDR